MICPFIRFLTVSSIILFATAAPAATPKALKYTYYRCTSETVESVSKLLGISTEDIARYNRNSVVRQGGRLKFKAGTKNVVYYSSSPFKRESVGRPNDGSLVGGMNLDCDGDDRGHGWIVSVERQHLYGTPETIRNIYRAARTYRAYFRDRGLDFIPLAIGDISRLTGGPLPPHVSHQSGRDVDIGIIRTDGNRPGRFGPAKPSGMDLLRTWVMIKSFLDTGDVHYIFIHRDLAAALKDYVARIYARQRPQLGKYLKQFGSGGVIRGDDEHSSHVHVRFKCPAKDRRCIP